MLDDRIAVIVPTRYQLAQMFTSNDDNDDCWGVAIGRDLSVAGRASTERHETRKPTEEKKKGQENNQKG